MNEYFLLIQIINAQSCDLTRIKLMMYLIIAVLCSVAVSVLLKILREKNIDIRQTIVAGYPVAFLLTWVLL